MAPGLKSGHGQSLQGLCRVSGKSRFTLWQVLIWPVDVSQGAPGVCSCKGPFPCPACLLQGFLQTGQAMPMCPAHPAHILAISPDLALLFLRILSNNPLAVIADAAFFKLPAMRSL